MSEIGFTCPDGKSCTYKECLAHCRLEARCMPLPILLSLLKEYSVEEVTDKKVIRATSLLYCLRRTYLQMTTPHTYSPLQRYKAWMGTSLHNSLERIGSWDGTETEYSSEVERLCKDYIREQRLKAKIPGLDCELTGKPDLYQISSKILFDYKKVDTDIYKFPPSESYVKQVNVYKWLLERNNYPVEKMFLIYIANSVPTMIRVNPIDQKVIEDMIVKNAKILITSIENKELPKINLKADQAWLCKFCPFHKKQCSGMEGQYRTLSIKKETTNGTNRFSL